MLPRQKRESSIAAESVAAVRQCLLDDLARIKSMAISPYDGSVINVDLNPERQKAVAIRFEQLLRVASMAAADNPIRWARAAMIEMLESLPEYSELLPLVDHTAAEETLRSNIREPSRPASNAERSPSNPPADSGPDSKCVSTEEKPRNPAVQEEQQSSPGTNQAAPEVDGTFALGRWADQRLPEARQFARLLWSGVPLEELQKQFQPLFLEVFDALYTMKKEKFFEDARRRKFTVPELARLLAEVKLISGSHLLDCRKKFRNAIGVTRKRHPKKHPNPPKKHPKTPQETPQ